MHIDECALWHIYALHVQDGGALEEVETQRWQLGSICMVGADCDLGSEDHAALRDASMKACSAEAEIDILVRLVNEYGRLLFELTGYLASIAKRQRARRR